MKLVTLPALTMKANGGLLSDRSSKVLATCHPDLQALVWHVTHSWDTSVLPLGGHRSREEQTRLYDEGRSKVRFPNSKHNAFPSEAVDISPFPIDWEDSKRWYWFNGFVLGVASKLEISLRSGSDWDGDMRHSDQTFHDLPHFELVNPRELTADELAHFNPPRVLAAV